MTKTIVFSEDFLLRSLLDSTFVHICARARPVNLKIEWIHNAEWMIPMPFAFEKLKEKKTLEHDKNRFNGNILCIPKLIFAMAVIS